MAEQVVSRKKAQIVALILFVVGVVVVAISGDWWPGILLPIGIPLAIREYLLGKTYDMFMSLFIFIGAFVTVQFEIQWEILLPVLFTIGGVYIFCRELVDIRRYTEDESEEDLNKEIADEDKD